MSSNLKFNAETDFTVFQYSVMHYASKNKYKKRNILKIAEYYHKV